MIQLPESFGVAPAIAFCALVITQQRLSPSTPSLSTSAFKALKSKNVGVAEKAFLVLPTNGPLRVVAPVTVVVLKRILLSSLDTANGINFLTIISIIPSVWLIVCLVTGIAIPIRCGVAVSLPSVIAVSVSATPSPAIVASDRKSVV